MVYEKRLGWMLQVPTFIEVLESSFPLLTSAMAVKRELVPSCLASNHRSDSKESANLPDRDTTLTNLPHGSHLSKLIQCLEKIDFPVE